MNELKPDDVMRALEQCGGMIDGLCKNCPLEADNYCNENLSKYALALLRERDAEIARLTEENERLVRANSAINNAVLAVERMAKADTVREMQERLKEYFPYDADSGLYVVLDQIAKEMVEVSE